MSAHKFSRRRFLSASSAAAGLISLGVHSSRAVAESASANEKLNIGFVGTANQAEFSIENCKHENIVALCDVDQNYLSKASEKFPTAKTYRDFRKMFEQKDLDAVAVCTPDHIHAPATLAALLSNKHVYCEKPLTHTVEEARLVRQAAQNNKKLATQMGTQIHATENYRRVVELVRSGAIGKIKEVHTFVHRGWSGGKRAVEADPVPAELDWDLWIGPAPMRPYHNNDYHPAQWRRWWDFGNGTLGDLGCHHLDLPFWALELTGPQTVTALQKMPDAETAPKGQTIVYSFKHPSGGEERLNITWHDGENVPKEIEGINVSAEGNLFVGEKGVLFANYNSWKLYPESNFKGFMPPPKSIPASVGHHQEWINSCKTGSPTLCNFDYAGRLTVMVLLGNVSFRVGESLQWDAERMQLKQSPGAQKFVEKEYRKGWELPKIG